MQRGGGFYCAESTPILKNVIIWGNTDSSGIANNISLGDESGDPSFMYCNIQGGIAGFETNGYSYSGVYENNINTDPLFVSPSDSVGICSEGLNSDWSLQDISPCIDSGTPDTTGLNLPETDIAGNPRVTVCKIDMGAHEYQYGSPLNATISVIQEILCYGDSDGELRVDASGGVGPYSYFWSNDQDSQSIIVPAGTYTVTVSETGYDCSVVRTVNLTQPAELIIDAGSNKSIACGDAVQLDGITSNYSGPGELTYNWLPTTGLNNATIPDPTSSAMSTTNYTVTATTPIGCNASDNVMVLLNQPLPSEEICYVGFDMEISKNSIHWRSDLSTNIDLVNVFKEVSTDLWSFIGSGPANQFYYIDANSNPFNQSYSYKISLTDKCGLETETSEFHTTITLLSAFDEGTNTYGFTWSAYQGLFVSNYFIYGITDSGEETLIGTLPGNQYFYNYSDPNRDFAKYFVAFNAPACEGKSEQLVRSNYVQSTSTNISETTEINTLVSIYPNPVNNKLYISSDIVFKNIDISLLTLDGKLIEAKEKISLNTEIDISDLNNGMYILKLNVDETIIYKRFIKY